MKPQSIAAALGAAFLLIHLPASADVQPASSLHPVRPLAEVAALALPAVDVASARAEDEARELQGEPPRFAIPEPVAIDPETHGTWEELADPRFLLWRLRVEVPEALSLNLGFDRFRLPKGARLVVHPAGGTELARAYTERDNQPHGELWTPVILGGELVVELTLPVTSRHDYELRLAQVGKGYRMFGEGSGEKAGWCNIDVVCPEGDPWREEISSVAVYTLNGYWTCSGVMVNNTAQDGTPYFLTANHCGISGGNAATMVVYWNFESPVCGQQGGGSLARSQSGAVFRATSSASDFCLVELQALPDPAWEISYSGWDRTSADWPQAVAIHHPSTDEKSISFEYDPTTTTSYLQSATPGNGTHIRVADWDLGTTEPGSSGSPLYNQNKHIVGQLHGGYAACGNDLDDWYGRLSVSWTGGGTDATRLSTWLDPLGAAPLTLDTFNPNASGLAVSPALPLSAQGDQGGPFTPASIDYTLENRGEASLNYAVAADQDWLGVAGGSGSLAPGATAVVTVSITSAANALPVGLHTGEVAFTNLTDGNGDTVRPARLQVGVPSVVYSWNLDTDPGWSRQAAWAWGQPTGQGGQYGNPDPTSGFTGVNVLGYNLDGDYTNYMPEYALTTDAIDCADLQLVTLRFRRWLNVEQPTYDKASLRVSTDGLAWTTIWENGSEITDGSWQLVVHDLSAHADGQETVYLQWVMGPTDSSWQFSGWNLDDIEILALQPTVTAAPGTPAAVTALLGAVPNPFNPLTEVRFTLARTQPARLAVHDARGRLVKVLVDGTLGAGPQSAVWDGTDEAGRRQGSGVYFLRLEAGEVRRTDKVVLVK